MKWLVINLIRLYRVSVAALLGGQCRFYPSCSVYCQEAVDRHGVWRGLALGMRRLAKCHPWHPGGVDLVP